MQKKKKKKKRNKSDFKPKDDKQKEIEENLAMQTKQRIFQNYQKFVITSEKQENWK